MQLMGHADIQTTLLYVQVTPKDPLPADAWLLARPLTKEALVRQLRDYLYQVCYSLGLSTRIVPHQLHHTYATEMLRSGVGFPAVMKLLGHTSPEMTR